MYHVVSKSVNGGISVGKPRHETIESARKEARELVARGSSQYFAYVFRGHEVIEGVHELNRSRIVPASELSMPIVYSSGSGINNATYPS